MAALRCPKCGTITYEGIRPYPRCRRCREHLLKCRYCAHFDRRLLDCGHPLLAEGSHINDPDLYAACPYHATTLRAGPARKALALLSSPPVLTALVLAVVIAGAAYAGLHYYQQANEVVPPHLTMRALVRPNQAKGGQTIWIKVDILNTGRVRAEHVTLYVDRAFVDAFTPVDLLPAPQASQTDDEWEHYDFGPLDRGAGLTVRYTLITRTAGTFPLRLRLLSDGTMAHGATTLNVSVTE